MKNIITIGVLLYLFLNTGIETNAQKPHKKYKTVYAEKVIKAPADKVWKAMVLDYGEISNFSPYIYASNYEKGSLKGALKAERKCSFDAKGSRWTHEKISEINHDRMVMKNVVIDAAKFPIDKENSFAYYKVKDNGDNTVTASYEFTYRTVPGFMTNMVKGKFRKTLEDTLTGLKYYIETGNKVNAKTGNWKEVKKLYN